MANATSWPLRHSLLSLPGEIRNRIYRLTVLSDVDFTIDANVFSEPPLLAVNKQLRKEAGTIFYGEQRLAIIMDDYDSTPLLALRQKADIIKELNVGRAVVTVSGPDDPNWKNLELWLKRIHTQGDIAMPLDDFFRETPTPLGVTKLLMSLFDMVLELADLPWTRVQKLVEGYRAPLAALQTGWDEEKDAQDDSARAGNVDV